jgi:hypothetical protein
VPPSPGKNSTHSGHLAFSAGRIVTTLFCWYGLTVMVKSPVTDFGSMRLTFVSVDPMRSFMSFDRLDR